jgi:hypothetical protein
VSPSSSGALLLFAALAIVSRGVPLTLAAFNTSTSSPGNAFAVLEVQPAVQGTPSSLSAGVVQLTWTASPTAASESVTYGILRRPSGVGAYVQVGTTAGLTFNDTPPADGLYDYAIRAAVTTLTTDSNALTARSDATAPSVTVTCDAAACKGAGWYTGSVSALATATDLGSGVSTTEITLDGSTTAISGSSVSLPVTGDGVHALSARATDVAGNVATPTIVSIRIDGTAPSAASGLAAATGASAGQVALTWTAGSDATSGVAGYTIRYVQSATCPAASPSAYPSTTSVGAVTAATVGELVSGKKYCFYLVTLDAAGNQSGPSNVANAKAK